MNSVDKSGDLSNLLSGKSRRWLVTGAAGFIGSNLSEFLLNNGQIVVGLDNFSTGHRRNLEDLRISVGDKAWKNFSLVEGDICSFESCKRAVEGVQVILHQAALGSVPRSIDNPLGTNQANVEGFLTVLDTARRVGVRRIVYASSSSVYGDSPELPKVEERVGRPLSPYAASKLSNEIYSHAFAECYGLEMVGLRYFNVFGKRQDPEGAYAAVIPRWIKALSIGESCVMNGDGETSRDFCYVANVVQANIRAALGEMKSGESRVYNVGVGEKTTLKDLYQSIAREVVRCGKLKSIPEPKYAPFRAGDVRHSLANVEKISKELGYSPTHSLNEGLLECVSWYLSL